MNADAEQIINRKSSTIDAKTGSGAEIQIRRAGKRDPPPDAAKDYRKV
jgi:hypothetical protein